MQHSVGSILLIGEDPESDEVLGDFLTGQGFVFHHSKSEHAVSNCINLKPDILLIDLELPGNNRLPLLQSIKSNPDTQSIPLLVISTLGNTQDIIQAIQVGAADFLTKPFALEEVLVRIHAHLTLFASQNQRTLGYDHLREAVSQQKVFEEQLHLQSAALHAAANAIVITDREGSVIWTNPAFTQLTGYSSEETYGKNPRILKSSRHEPINYQDLWRTILAGNIWHGELYNKRKDGSEYPEEMTITPVYNNSNQITHFIAIKQDISERVQAIEALKHERDFSEAIINTAGALVVVLSPQGVIIRFNHACELTVGYTANEMEGKAIWDVLLLPEEKEPVRSVFDQLSIGKFPNQYENHWIAKNGELHLISWSNTILFGVNGKVEYIIGTGIDITERKKFELALQESENRFRELTEKIHEAFWSYDYRASRLIYISPAYEEIWGRPIKNLVQNNREWLDTIHPEDIVSAQEAFYRITQTGGGEIWQFRIIRPNGTIRWIQNRGFAIYDDDGSILRLVGIAEDVTERKDIEMRMQHLATHDNLTNLPNRSLFFDRLGHAIANAQRNNQKVGVLFLDLDGFKNINDNMGHEMGDQLLTEVAGRLTGCVRESDTVARLGGDEFSLCLENIQQPLDAAAVAGKIISALCMPFETISPDQKISCSIGISIYPDDGNNIQVLLSKADKAMYQVKASGKNGFIFSSLI